MHLSCEVQVCMLYESFVHGQVLINPTSPALAVVSPGLIGRGHLAVVVRDKPPCCADLLLELSFPEPRNSSAVRVDSACYAS